MYNYTWYRNFSPQTIAIVGGGLSGTLVAVNLMKNATTPLIIKLIERRTEIGRGIAYSTTIDGHLLNVPAGKMSAFADQPNHFLDWLQANGHHNVTENSFISRKIYGNYIQAILQEAQANARENVHFEKITDEAIAIEAKNNHIKIYLRQGQCLQAQKAVLALGNPPPSLPAAFGQNSFYIKDAWSGDPTSNLNPEDSILLLGTGLTMVDVVVSLHQQGFRGKIHAVSRHGLIPQPHQHTISSYPTFINLETAPKTVRELLKLIRQEVKKATKQGQNWQAVIDALRPVTPELWEALPLKEQKRFLRHGKAYWETHRHRIAREIHEVLKSIENLGQLNYYAGRIQACQELENKVNVTIRKRGTNTNIILQVNRIINCTGSNNDYRRLQDPLIASLQQQGLIRPHALGIGIDTAANGAVIDVKGNISEILYTLGPPRKGNLWETTAVGEIRLQATNLVKELLKPVNCQSDTHTGTDNLYRNSFHQFSMRSRQLFTQQRES